MTKGKELKKEELITQTFKDIESYTDKCSEDEISKVFDDVKTRYSKLGFKGVDDEYTGDDKIAIIWLMENLFEKVWDEARRDFIKEREDRLTWLEACFFNPDFNNKQRKFINDSIKSAFSYKIKDIRKALGKELNP